MKNFYKNRAIISNEFNSLTIIIPSKINWIIFIPVFILLAFWIGSGWFIIHESIDLKNFQNSNNYFLYLWLFGWFSGSITVIKYLTWSIFGKEITTIGRGVLSIKKSYLMNYGIKNNYDINKISKMAVIPQPKLRMIIDDENNHIKYKKGKIKFFYEKTEVIQFANDVNEEEANKLLQIMKESKYLLNKNFN